MKKINHVLSRVWNTLLVQSTTAPAKEMVHNRGWGETGVRSNASVIERSVKAVCSVEGNWAGHPVCWSEGKGTHPFVFTSCLTRAPLFSPWLCSSAIHKISTVLLTMGKNGRIRLLGGIVSWLIVAQWLPNCCEQWHLSFCRAGTFV